ncbi:Hypothetical_protein [Hexamita inflata]|uniref:Hypothetical_protein n=1 Tax=Hexamita inflata TaxID=28002 RepID=A0AA86TVL9_9EUKA|nr:Hypothetical protein HINF_LOCUS10938 [Hexamita inflata]
MSSIVDGLDIFVILILPFNIYFAHLYILLKYYYFNFKLFKFVLTLFDPEGGIESVVGLLQFLQIMLIPDTQDSKQNGFHIPRTDLKCEAKKQRKNEQISNFDFLIMLQIRILSLKSYGGYYRVSQSNLLNNFPCVFEDEFQWSWQLGSWRLQFFQKLNHVWHLSLHGHCDAFTNIYVLLDQMAVCNFQNSNFQNLKQFQQEQNQFILERFYEFQRTEFERKKIHDFYRQILAYLRTFQ